MTLTNFPNGVSSYGIPLLGSMGIPFTGNHFFVDYVNGNDVNEGTADSPKKTIKHALSLCVSGNNDVIWLIGHGDTAGTHRLTETLVWDKNATHMIGITAPTLFANRARIAAANGVTGFTPLVKVTGAGCMFANFHSFHGYATAVAQTCWQDAGQRNMYSNVHILGMGEATAAAQAGGLSLHIDGGAGAATPTTGLGEHTFIDCVIGGDTVTRSAANANLKLSGATPRNVFKGCVFPVMTSDAAAVFVAASGSGDLDRETIFDNCLFLNNIKSTSTQMTRGFNLNASVGGMVILNGPLMVGATDFETNGAPTNNMFIMGPVPVAATTGIAVNNA